MSAPSSDPEVAPDPDRTVVAFVVVGMSVREVEARPVLESWAASVGGEVAFLQVGDPSLSRVLTRLADAGVRDVVLVGAALGPLAPGHSWLARVAGHWLRSRAGSAPSVSVVPGLLRSVGDGILHLLDVGRQASGPGATTHQVPARARPVTGQEAPLASPAWESVTEHAHQVLVCRGPRCTALGSDATAEALVLALMSHELGDDDVLVTHTGCLFPCNQAPVVAVQPDDVWYGAVTAADARRIVAEHVVGGVPPDVRRLPRTRRQLG